MEFSATALSEEGTENFFRKIQEDVANSVNLRSNEEREWEKFKRRNSLLEQEEIIHEEGSPTLLQSGSKRA